MAIGQIPGNGQDAFSALGNSLSNALDSQAQTALKMKMQAAFLRQQQGMEQEKFQREQIATPEGVSAVNELLPKLGINTQLGDNTSLPELGMLAHLANMGLQKQLMMQMKAPAGNALVKTDEVGIPMWQSQQNMLGVELNKHLFPDYSSKRQMYDKNATYVQLLNQAHSLYNELSVHNALGAGGLLNHLPEDLAAKRSQLIAINQQLAPLEASVDEGVPGGRFSSLLGESLKSTTQNPQHTASVANDLFNNSMLRAYSRMKALGPDSVQIPQTLTDMFGGLPHDVNGNLIFEPRDLRIEDGKVYAGNRPDPIYDINNPKPSIDVSTVNKLHNIGAAKASASNPFADDGAFQAALQKVRGKH